MDAVLGGLRVDGSYQEVHLVDMRLHPQDLLHKNCMHACSQLVIQFIQHIDRFKKEKHSAHALH